jgi:hypothetical protein
MSTPPSLLTSVQSSIIPRTVCFKILPFPTRTWNRFQGECSLFTDSTSSFNQNLNQTVTIPLTGKVVSAGDLANEIAMLNKGNVLQYKKNSSSLTKKQQYALIAQGKWVNRKTWATQSASGYTNPNTKRLQRVNSVDLPIDVGAVEPIIIQDLGNLVCGTLENLDTGEVIFRQPANDFCFPTYCSDVPGPITDLCWNDGIVPWFPRTRTTMSVSGDKFPINATLISAAVIDPPILTMTSYTDTTVTLSWTIPDSGLPITSFIVYQNINGSFVPIDNNIVGQIDPETNLIVLTTTYTVTGIIPNNQLYAFYVKSVSNTQPVRSESKPSTIVINSEQIFTLTGSPNQYVIDNIYVIEFTQSGQLIINNGISMLSTIFCMGGGGAGGTGTTESGGGGGGGGGITNIYTIISGTYVITVGLGGVINVSNGLTSQIVKGLTTILSAAGGINGSTSVSSNGANGGKSGTQGSLGGTGATANNNATSGTLGGGGGGGGGTNAYSNSGASGSTNVPFGFYNRTDFGLGGHGGNTYSLTPPSSGLPNTGCGGEGGTSVNLQGGSGGSGLIMIYFSL